MLHFPSYKAETFSFRVEGKFDVKIRHNYDYPSTNEDTNTTVIMHVDRTPFSLQCYIDYPEYDDNKWYN